MQQKQIFPLLSLAKVVSSKHRKDNARFVWKNLTRDGGAMLSGTLDLGGYVENSSSYFLNYLDNGFYD